MILACPTQKWTLISTIAFALAISPVESYAEADHFPPMATVLSNVCRVATQEQANERTFKSRYSFLRTRTTREFDGKGCVVKETTKKNPNNPPISAVSYVAPSSRVVVSTNASGVTTVKTGGGQGFEKSDFVLNDELFCRFDFTIVRREQIEGRNTLMIEFKPANKKLPSRSLKDRFLAKTAGKVWVDESDWNLAKGDFRLLEKVNVVGGLVGAVKNFNYKFDRQRTEDGLWFTRKVHWRLEGRELFSGKVIEYDENRADVKRVR